MCIQTGRTSAWDAIITCIQMVVAWRRDNIAGKQASTAQRGGAARARATGDKGFMRHSLLICVGICEFSCISNEPMYHGLAERVDHCGEQTLKDCFLRPIKSTVSGRHSHTPPQGNILFYFSTCRHLATSGTSGGFAPRSRLISLLLIRRTRSPRWLTPQHAVQR